MPAQTKSIAIGLIVAILGTAIGWWAYSAYQKRELRKTVQGLVADTSTQLRSGLTAAEGNDERFAAAERNLAKLKSLDAAREQQLADAADDYLLTGREILKRVAESQRHRRELAESLQALQQHMRADDRSGAWGQEAVKLRERVNKDHRGYAAAVAVLDKLLQSFPDSQKRIAPHVEPALLIDATTLEQARTGALAAAKQVEAEVAKSRQLETFR